MAKKKTKVDSVKDKLREKASRRDYASIPAKDYLSTGSTVLNLACSNKVTGGIPKGTIVHYVGDSDSGKTMFALTAFAEAANSSAFDDYDLVFYNAEDGALMDLADKFGSRVVERLQEERPEMLEDFYYSIDERIKSGRPFVAVLDSMDVLWPKAWYKKMQTQKKAASADKEAAGDYGTAKAKINSENLRKIRSDCSRMGSILIIISQTRDNLNARFGDKKTVSGGHVLKFYSAIQLWTSTLETIRKSVLGKPRAIGIISRISIKKNHITGNKRVVDVPILNDLGVDDIGSCVDFLVSENYWKSSAKTPGKGKITAPGFSDEAVSRDKLIQLIEKNDRERELRKLVKEVWMAIEEGCKTNRKKRYE